MKPSQITSLKVCEDELDRALLDLRKLSKGGTNNNVLAAASIEYRIGALRRRREDLR
jgi:hypothetical protein